MQFRLRTLLIAVTLVTLPLGYVAWERQQCRRGQQAMEMLNQKSEYLPAVTRFGTSAYNRPKWLKSILGDDEFRRVNNAVLGGNSFSDSDVRALALLPNLDYVVIESPNVTDEGVTHLRGLKKVERFHVIGNRSLSGKSWAVLGEWQHLHVLWLDGSHFGGDGILQLPALANLKELSVNNTNLTDAGLERISWLPNLESLDLSHTQVSDAGLVHLKRLANLKDLTLENTKITNAGVKELRKALPNAVISHWKS
ncbi:MAG: hypothetical protein IAF94_21455 [Pirellulaceae bacterium]|nr:hypothetical protein [Pirellulaceae bacterium]